MKFTVKNYTTKWHALEIGIMIGCVISPLLFVLAMELILRGAANTSKGVMKNEHLTLPPSRAYMDDITILVPSQIAADGLLQRYYDLFTWARMKAKPKKSRSLSLDGGSVREIHFKIGGDKIPTVREKSVKSLGHLYSIPLTDRHMGTEVQKVALKGLKSIDKTCLPGKMKAWCYKHGLLPRLLWPLQMYEIAISRVERIQQYSNCVSGSEFLLVFWKVGLYTISGNLEPPISSLVEEFKIGIVRLHMMMKDSADVIIRKGYPEIKSGTKWSAVETTQEAECSLRIKDIIGGTQINRAGLGSANKRVFSKVDPKGKRDMVSEEIRMFEEEQRKASAVTQAKQYAWTKCNDIEPIRLSWKSLLAMEPLAISFLLRSTCDLLPNATNLKLWGYTNSDLCLSCRSDRGTFCHVISACPQSLQMYTWRYNKVLKVIIELLRVQCETANQQSITAKEPIIQFLKEGECPVRKQKHPNMKLLNGDSDWNVSADLKTSLQFPVHIIQTEKRPDIVAWSVPWEENREEAHERKKNRYKTLRADCVEKGWICHVIPIEVGCRGFIGHSVISFLSKIGITGRSLKVASNLLQTTAQYASSWIWSKARSFQHERNTCGTTFPV